MRFVSDKQRRAVFAALTRPTRKRRIRAIDTETTGFSKKDRILEFSAAGRDQKGKIVAYHSPINAHHYISPYAQAVHGITYDDVQHAPEFSELRKEIHELVRSSGKIVGHNLAFDARMLQQEGIDIPEEKKVCTLVLAREKGIGSRVSLDTLCQELDVRIPPEQRHHAAADTIATLRCYEKMIARGATTPQKGA